MIQVPSAANEFARLQFTGIPLAGVPSQAVEFNESPAMHEPAHDLTKEELQKIADDRWLTVPNVLCLIRLLGSLTLVPAAISGRADVVIALFVALALTDGIDGLIARWCNQRSRIGPKLDSLADVAMFSMLMFALFWLRSDVIFQELLWLLIAAITFCVACGAAVWKFGVLPSYHTMSAKASWICTVLAALSLLLNWSIWPLRIATAAVFLANLESIAITAMLARPESDVASLAAARRIRDRRE